MTVFSHDVARIFAAGIHVMQKHRYKHLFREGAEHAHRLVDEVREPWLYREVAT